MLGYDLFHWKNWNTKQIHTHGHEAHQQQTHLKAAKGSKKEETEENWGGRERERRRKKREFNREKTKKERICLEKKSRKEKWEEREGKRKSFIYVPETIQQRSSYKNWMFFNSVNS